MSNKFFTSIKHNSSNPAMIRHFASNYPSLQIACGNDLQFLEFCSWGSKSWVGGLSNCFPQIHIEIFTDAIINKNFDRAGNKLLKLKQVIDYILSIGKYTQSVKFLMQELGFCSDLCRSPYLKLALKEKNNIRKLSKLII